jgi:hypothetical protein
MMSQQGKDGIDMKKLPCFEFGNSIKFLSGDSSEWFYSKGKLVCDKKVLVYIYIEYGYGLVHNKMLKLYLVVKQ